MAAQEGNETVQTDVITSRLEKLSLLIEKESEVTEEFQDLMRSTLPDEVATYRYHERNIARIANAVQCHN